MECGAGLVSLEASWHSPNSIGRNYLVADQLKSDDSSGEMQVSHLGKKTRFHADLKSKSGVAIGMSEI